jgi:hypothetical protein
LVGKLTDSTTKAIPALHYIAVTAQGAQEKQHAPHAYHKQIDTIISWAKPINALVLDIQVGHSVKAEVAELEKYLAMPNVHLELTLNFR